MSAWLPSLRNWLRNQSRITSFHSSLEPSSPAARYWRVPSFTSMRMVFSTGASSPAAACVRTSVDPT